MNQRNGSPLGGPLPEERESAAGREINAFRRGECNDCAQWFARCENRRNAAESSLDRADREGPCETALFAAPLFRSHARVSLIGRDTFDRPIRLQESSRDSPGIKVHFLFVFSALCNGCLTDVVASDPLEYYTRKLSRN